MKITNYDDTYSQKLGLGETTLVSGSSGGSNSSLGGDVSGTLGNVSVNGLRRSVSLGSNLGTGVAIGDVLTILSTAGTPVARFATPSNTGGGSFGSNATRVSKNSSVGASANGSREDHIHDGIGTITASSSNTLGRGTFNLRAGNNISIGYTDTDADGLLDTATIHGVASAGGSGVTSINKTGSTALTGAVTLTGGTNVTLTQVGQDISIAAASGGGGSSTPASVPNVVQARTNGNAATSITVTAAASGNRFVMVTNSTTGQVTAPACTNVTFTQLVTFTSTASSFYAIWVGVVAGGSSGTSITMTKPGSFNTVAVLEVTDALTPTVGASATANQAGISGTGADIRTFARLASTTTGRFVALSYCLDNTGNVPTIFPGVPATGVFMSPGVTLVVGYVGGASVSFGTYSINSAGASLIAEIT